MRKLGIRNLKREHGGYLCTALEKMTHLRSLIVSSIDPRNEILDVQSISSPPLQLPSLRLRGQLEMVPDWISKLHNLAKLRLSFSNLTDGSFKILQTLPNLKYLGLIGAYNGEKIHFEGGGYQKLKFLYLAGLSHLSTMLIDEGALPVLEGLAMGPCPQLKKVPSGFQHLKYLKELSFAGMTKEFTQRLSQQDHEIVRHVPILRYDGIYDPSDERSYAAWQYQVRPAATVGVKIWSASAGRNSVELSVNVSGTWNFVLDIVPDDSMLHKMVCENKNNKISQHGFIGVP
ncbi:unnamed protein product [Dovyalis caffra]|uniref:Disease resistance R13L4/SHOC-2-like LRR domain-containing protein n=1 Tax=Dovyalis caffra TaxID=77055 RepID=A0AAV1RVP9_9ROSI|nr:unnamed protein product [Dovyalis caffra]